MNPIKKFFAVKTVYSDNKTFLIFSVEKKEEINYPQVQMFETGAYREYLLPFQCTKTSKSNKISFDVSGLTSLSEYLKTEMKQDQYFEIVSGIQKVIAFCKDSRLSCDNLVFEADPMFMVTKDELDAVLKPENYTGRSSQQVDEFLAECIKPILEANKDILGESFEMKN